ncbi:MAG: hypothetical protein AMJ78_00080 [Omnitrophica WOR_2 bacterium SM23_29]|nr:MAG: hypothetical protein AMJ78_00080 [Omnitrophica WOR_2 bacterium SM23_29]
MSIIYEALKTTDSIKKEDKEISGRPKPKFKIPRKIVYIVGILIVLGILTLLAGKLLKGRPSIFREASKKFPTMRKGLSAKITPLSITPDERASFLVKKIPPLFLNGIFLSDRRYVALINGQAVGVGDSIEGVQIEKVESDGVVIKFEGSLFQLSYP